MRNFDEFEGGQFNYQMTETIQLFPSDFCVHARLQNLSTSSSSSIPSSSSKHISVSSCISSFFILIHHGFTPLIFVLHSTARKRLQLSESWVFLISYPEPVLSFFDSISCFCVLGSCKFLLLSGIFQKSWIICIALFNCYLLVLASMEVKLIPCLFELMNLLFRICTTLMVGLFRCLVELDAFDSF